MKLLADFFTREEIDENRQKAKSSGKSLLDLRLTEEKMFRRVGEVGDDGQTKKKGPEYLPNPLLLFSGLTGSRTPGRRRERPQCLFIEATDLP